MRPKPLADHLLPDDWRGYILISDSGWRPGLDTGQTERRSTKLLFIGRRSGLCRHCNHVDSVIGDWRNPWRDRAKLLV
jgi:hypothetical protein